MKNFFFTFGFSICSILLLGSFNENQNHAKVIQFETLDSLLKTKNDTTYIINFWATWCIPCVAELPHFVEFQEKHNSEKVQTILISLDFVSALDKKLNPFLEKKNYRLPVFLLNEPDYNSWIDKVEPSWSGAIPATLIYNSHTNKKIFIEKELNFELLEQEYLKISN